MQPYHRGSVLSHSVRKWLGICEGISRSPTVRQIMSAKLSRLRYPEARFLTMLTIRLRSTPTALVRFLSVKATMLSKWFLPYRRTGAVRWYGYAAQWSSSILGTSPPRHDWYNSRFGRTRPWAPMRGWYDDWSCSDYWGSGYVPWSHCDPRYRARATRPCAPIGWLLLPLAFLSHRWCFHGAFFVPALLSSPFSKSI